jgi:uncharacterized protein
MYDRAYRSSPSLAIMLMALIGFVAQAQSRYPKAKDLYINDFAGILNASDTISIRTALAKLRGEAGVQGVVVTIPSIQIYKTSDRTIESFATNLFNDWGIGDRERNDGVLILVAVKDRKVRIELGAGYGDSYNTQMQSVISNQMLPHFKKKNLGLGIIEGTNAIVRIMSERASTVTHAQTPMPAQVTSASFDQSTTDSSDRLTLLAIAGVVIAAAFGMMWYMRSRRQRCFRCRVRMIRLDGGSENQHLDDGQKVENSLGSVDYRVWQCPTCGHHELMAQTRRLSSFGNCRSCGYRTLKVSELITVHPTDVTPGEKQIDETCYHCEYRNLGTIILPMLPPQTDHTQYGYDDSHSSSFGFSDSGFVSSSSSGYDSGGSSSSGFDSGSSSSSSYDGGSSSGDGASGSW